MMGRRGGALKTCWTKPLPGCSAMGMASWVGIDARGRRGGGRREHTASAGGHGSWPGVTGSATQC